MKTNADRLPVQSLMGQVSPTHMPPYWTMAMDEDGVGQIICGGGGIAYNYHLGDPCFKMVGDRVTPDVCTSGGVTGRGVPDAYGTLTCIGNKAVVAMGAAAGAEGTVIGKMIGPMGNCLVTVHFPQEVLEKMNGTEGIAVRGCGTGLSIEGFEDVTLINCDPALLEKLGVEAENGALRVPVKKIFPVTAATEGIGYRATYGACELNGDEQESIRELCIGDIVCIQDLDSAHMRTYIRDAVTIGVVSYGGSPSMGAGPGVTTIMTAHNNRISPYISPNANIAECLGLRKEVH